MAEQKSSYEVTSQILQKNKQQVLEIWLKNLLKNEAVKHSLISDGDLRKQSEEFVEAFLKALKTGADDVNSKEFDELNDILSGISISRAREGSSPKETASYILSFKDTIIEVVENHFKNDPTTLYRQVLILNRIIDELSILTFEVYLKGREEVIIRQTDEISEISTPVISVWEGILALPIIGTLDSARTQIVMENLLQKIVDTNSSIAILDISGVPAVDSLVAQHLIKTVSATRLMGAECIISGIRAEIAQTIVHLGIDLSNIKTKASLASALKLAFSMLDIEMKKKDKSPLFKSTF